MLICSSLEAGILMYKPESHTSTHKRTHALESPGTAKKKHTHTSVHTRIASAYTAFWLAIVEVKGASNSPAVLPTCLFEMPYELDLSCQSADSSRATFTSRAFLLFWSVRKITK